MSYKSLNEVESVIALGKPITVVDMFLESYLQGLEYYKWAEGKDLTTTHPVVIGQDEGGVDITEEQLVNVYTPIDVSAEMAQWKLDNYALLRQYDSLGDQFDRLTKALAYMHSNGVDIGISGIEQVDRVSAVKLKYPKA